MFVYCAISFSALIFSSLIIIIIIIYLLQEKDYVESLHSNYPYLLITRKRLC